MQVYIILLTVRIYQEEPKLSYHCINITVYGDDWNHSEISAKSRPADDRKRNPGEYNNSAFGIHRIIVLSAGHGGKMTKRKDNGKCRKKKPETKVDILDFRLYDVEAAGEIWAVEIFEYNGKRPATVQVLVNGRDINDIYGLMGKLGHNEVRWTYMLMQESLKPKHTEWEREYDYEFACCISCGEPGCNYIAVVVTEDGEYIRWKTWYRFGDPNDIRCYCFLRTQYMEAMAKLWTLLTDADRKHFLADSRRTVYAWEV